MLFKILCESMVYIINFKNFSMYIHIYENDFSKLWIVPIKCEYTATIYI